MRKPIILGFAIALIGALGAGGQTPPLPEIVSVAKSGSVLDLLSRLGFDFLADRNGRLYIVAPPGDVQRLESLEIPFRYETWSFAPTIPRRATQGGPIGAFHTGPQLEKDLLDLQARHPGLAKVFDIGRSLENRPIYALKISDNVAAEEDEAETLILGCHHAREWISVEVPFLLGKTLLERYASDPEVRQIVDQSEIWIVPLVNPDGHDYSVRVYRYWRKNRRDSGGGDFGVDINRNYGFQWGIDNVGSSPNPASEVYRGTSAFSEPETRAVRDLFLRKDFRAVVSYHSYSQAILYPWGYTAVPPPDAGTLRDLGGRMAGLIREVNGRTYDVGPGIVTLAYLTNGDTIDWTYGTAGVPSYTIELPPVDQLGGGFFNREEDIQPIFRENLPALFYLLEWAANDYAARPRVPSPELKEILRPMVGRPRR